MRCKVKKHLTLGILMLVTLFLPLPWASYGGGHGFTTLHFILFSWSLIPYIPPVRFHDPRLFLILSLIIFAGGFVFLTLYYLLSVAFAQLRRKRLNRIAAPITLLSALVVGLMWPRSPESKLLAGFWLTAGMAGIAAVIEVIEMLRSKKGMGVDA